MTEPTDYAALCRELRRWAQTLCARGDYGDMAGVHMLDHAAAALEALVRENAELRAELKPFQRWGS